MADHYDEINLLVNDIIEGKVSKDAAADRIKALKKEYGEAIFPSINFQKEPQPWNNEYLSKLKKMNITGACSEEFLLHMAEVSEKIASRKKRRITVVVAAAVIFFMILAFVLGRMSQLPESAAVTYEFFYITDRITDSLTMIADFVLII